MDTHTHTHPHTHTPIHTQICTTIYTYTFIHTHTCIHSYPHTHPYTHTHIHIHIHTAMHTYAHTHTHLWLSEGTPLPLGTHNVTHTHLIKSWALPRLSPWGHFQARPCTHRCLTMSISQRPLRELRTQTRVEESEGWPMGATVGRDCSVSHQDILTGGSRKLQTHATTVPSLPTVVPPHSCPSPMGPAWGTWRSCRSDSQESA